MEWIFKISDEPKIADFPVEAHYEPTPGLKSKTQFFSLEQIIEVLQNRDFEEDTLESSELARADMVISPILPEGTIMYAQHPNNELEQIAFEIPQKTFDIQYKTSGNLHAMPFPRMIVICELEKSDDKKKIGSMRVFAVENNQQPITEDTPLFSFPYTNVMKSTGSVCWGLNKRILVSSLHEVRKAIFLFLSAPFNEDHGVRTTLGINEFQALIKKLEGQPFSDEYLLPLNKTLDAVMNETNF